MGDVLAWGLFLAIIAGIVWCVWILAREAHQHVTWHIARRGGWVQPARALPMLELPDGFVVVPAQHPVGRPEVRRALRVAS